MSLCDSPEQETENQHPISEQGSTEDSVLKARRFDFYNAKANLLHCKDLVNDSVYEHMVKIIKFILRKNGDAKLEDLEELSRAIKLRLHTFLVERATKVEELSLETRVALSHRKNYQQQDKPLSPIRETNIPTSALPDIMGIFNAFQLAGIGCYTSNAYNLLLSLKTFVNQSSLNGLRFWGKIFGVRHNYYIIEADNDLQGIATDPISRKNEDIQSQKAETSSVSDEGSPEFEIDPPPRSVWQTPVEIPPEDPGIGVNKKAYYVCNDLHEKWIRLPEATAKQISVSRFIRYLFTGDLEAKIDTSPPFPGVEKNLLRALIARISATTTISPTNYYQFDEEEEAENEEDEFRENIVENTDYEPLSTFELTEDSLANWVHHSAYILPQGRTRWWNPKSNLQGKENETMDEDEEELEEQEELEPEAGPPLLTPLSEDATVAELPPWSTRVTSHLVPQHAYAVLSSNLWPGAHALASGRFFENVYVGWGQKYLGADYAPVINLEVFEEFPSGPEVAEVDDPSAEEEAAWKAAQAEAAKLAAEEAEEEEEEESADNDEEEEEED